MSLKSMIKRGAYKKRGRTYPVCGSGLAWELPGPKGKPGQLCNWAMPDAVQLESSSPKPQINARAVEVVIISREELKNLLRSQTDGEVKP